MPGVGWGLWDGVGRGYGGRAVFPTSGKQCKGCALVLGVIHVLHCKDKRFLHRVQQRAAQVACDAGGTFVHGHHRKHALGSPGSNPSFHSHSRSIECSTHSIQCTLADVFEAIPAKQKAVVIGIISPLLAIVPQDHVMGFLVFKLNAPDRLSCERINKSKAREEGASVLPYKMRCLFEGLHGVVTESVSDKDLQAQPK